MDPLKHSSVFNNTVFIWKLFGLWSDKSSSIIFKVYSYVFVFFTSILYFFFYTLHLIHTPLTVEIFVTQAIYYFSAMTGITRVVVILIKRQEIIANLQLMDCKEFQGHDNQTKEYMRRFQDGYTKYFKLYFSYCKVNLCVFLIGWPLLNHFLRGEELKLPICDYYFLTDEIRSNYFYYWYIYQTVGVLSTIMNNVTAHTFMCGIIYMAITQFKILNWNIAHIQLDNDDITKTAAEKEEKYFNKFLQCLKHYEIILRYCENIQDITNFIIFSAFGLAAITLCLCMYMFLLLDAGKDLVFVACFTAAMLLENFAPSLLGSQLTHESNDLRFAAYSYDWVNRSQSLKKSLIILMTRAHTPVVITGLKMVSLSLETFASIVKTAYSFFTLLNGTQD